MASQRELEATAIGDEAIRKLLLAVPQLDEFHHVACPRVTDGRPCGRELVMCSECRAAGCWAALGCSNMLIDRSNTCVRCGHRMVMNRTVKLTTLILTEAWKKLHGRA